MEAMRQMLERLGQAWRAMSFNQRAIVGTVVAASVLSVIIFSVWLNSDTMVVLYSGLDPDEALETLAELLGFSLA